MLGSICKNVKNGDYVKKWCPRQDLNLYSIATTST